MNKEWLTLASYWIRCHGSNLIHKYESANGARTTIKYIGTDLVQTTKIEGWKDQQCLNPSTPPLLANILHCLSAAKIPVPVTSSALLWIAERALLLGKLPRYEERADEEKGEHLQISDRVPYVQDQTRPMRRDQAKLPTMYLHRTNMRLPKVCSRTRQTDFSVPSSPCKIKRLATHEDHILHAFSSSR